MTESGMSHAAVRPAGSAVKGELFALIAAGDVAAASAWLAADLTAEAVTRAARTLAAHAVRGAEEFAWISALVRVSPPFAHLMLAVDDALARSGHRGERRSWLETAAEFCDAHPDNRTIRAGVWRRFAEICLAQRDAEGAARAVAHHRERAETWWTDTPGDPAARLEIACAHVLAGDFGWRFLRDAAGASAAWQCGLAELEPGLPSLAPGHEQALWVARICARLGHLGRDRGDLGTAMGAYRRCLAIGQRGAVAQPLTTAWQHELACCHGRMGDVLGEQHDPAGALLAHRQSLDLFERLHLGDVGHVGAERDLATAHLKVGDSLLALGQPGGALVAYRHGASIRARLAAARGPGADPELRHELWVAYSKMAEALERAGSDEAVHWWQQAYKVLAALKDAGQFRAAADEQFLVWLRQKAFAGCRSAGP